MERLEKIGKSFESQVVSLRRSRTAVKDQDAIPRKPRRREVFDR